MQRRGILALIGSALLAPFTMARSAVAKTPEPQIEVLRGYYGCGGRTFTVYGPVDYVQGFIRRYSLYCRTHPTPDCPYLGKMPVEEWEYEYMDHGSYGSYTVYPYTGYKRAELWQKVQCEATLFAIAATGCQITPHG